MNKTADARDDKIRELEKSVRGLKVATFALGGLLMIVATAGFTNSGSDILRARGLIIEDAEGRARILIGAPLPSVPERLRTDAGRYDEAFGQQLGRYAADVGNLRNDGVGILVLDENGHDRVALGSPIPDPLNGRRIGNMTGLSFHAADGVERGGIGQLINEETGLDRSVIGLDSVHGEGAVLMADSDGTNGLVVAEDDGGRLLFVGRAPGDGLLGDGHTEARLGLLTRDQSGQGIYVGANSDGVERIRPPVE
ncbi:MAG: hypothetical protein J0L52_08180 [Caulobacterales bacterium]|nr:hypothetical protein [Caulobacterales bacterium]